MRGEMDKFPSGWRWGNVLEYKRRVLLERNTILQNPYYLAKAQTD